MFEFKPDINKIEDLSRIYCPVRFNSDNPELNRKLLQNYQAILAKYQIMK